MIREWLLFIGAVAVGVAAGELAARALWWTILSHLVP